MASELSCTCAAVTPAMAPWVEASLETRVRRTSQALGAARVAIAKMEAAGVPWRRPADYYAEMVKTDDHMLKVREQLAHEQKQIEEAAQRSVSSCVTDALTGRPVTGDPGAVGRWAKHTERSLPACQAYWQQAQLL